MNDSITWVGMDVHKETMQLEAIDGRSGSMRASWETPNSPRGKERLAKRLLEMGEVRCVYEAGPCGYDLFRFLEQKGIRCDVAAPSLIPKKPGDRIKTDRRDAQKLAHLHRMGELTTIRVPTPAQESLRDLVRAREDACQDLVRRRHRLGKFLLRRGRRLEGKKAWTKAHWDWLCAQTFDDPCAEAVFREYLLGVTQEMERVKRLDEEVAQASKRPEVATVVSRLRALRGVDTLTAMTVVTETIDFSRFFSPRELMAFVGLVPSERSSGEKKVRGSITKTGNAHVRRILVESAWNYQHLPRHTNYPIQKRREGQPPEVIEVARKAEIRLHKKFVRMVARGKPRGTAAVAVARELAGFVWAIATM